MLIRLISPFMYIFELIFNSLQKLFGPRQTPWVFLFPMIVLFLLFVFLPFILNIMYSFTGGENILLNNRPFVASHNFEQLLRCQDYSDFSTCDDDLFWKSIHNTAFFVIYQVGFMIFFSLITALVLNRKIAARGFFRASFFFPVLLSPVVVALIWKWILQYNGLMNVAMDFVQLGRINWLVQPNWAFFWVVTVSIWAHMGFYTLILLAGLQAIPPDVYEAAKMDKASPFRVFHKITIPLLMPTLLVVIILAVIKSIQTFDEVYVLTGGGPGSATVLILQYIFETGFGGTPRLLGLAAAASIVLVIALILLTIVQLQLNKKR